MDSITITFSSDLAPVGYVRAMNGLTNMNIDEIILGCNEEMSKRGEYFAQSCILHGYMKTVVFLYEPETIDLLQLNDIMFDKETPLTIQFSAILCRAHMNYQICDCALNTLATELPDNGLVYIVKSGMLTKQRVISSVERYKGLRRCCLLLPNFYEAHAEKAFVHASFRVKALKELTLRFPNELDARLKLAQLYLIKNNKREVENVLNEAQRDFPDESDKIDVFRGYLGARSIVELFSNLIKGNPEYFIGYKGLFYYHWLRTGQLDKALEVATMALQKCMDQDFNQRMFELRQTLIGYFLG